MRVISRCPPFSIDSQITDRFRRFAESVVRDEFRKLRQSEITQGDPFQIYLRCNNESHGHNGSRERFSLEKLKGNDVISCPDMTEPHSINSQQALSEWFNELSNIELRKDCQLNQKQLSKISRAIGNNWRLLGIGLGLNQAQLDRIDMDNERSIMRIYNMLSLWLDENNENATLNTLIQAMESRQEDVTIVWDEVRNIVDEILSSQ